MAKFEFVMDFFKENRKYLKIGAVVLICTTALLLFYEKGENQEIVVNADSSNKETESEATGGDDIFIDIGGEINKPGVYSVSAGSRIYQVVEKAGGLTENADTYSVNMAQPVSDGEKIIIPSEVDTACQNQGDLPISTPSSGTININTADESDLCDITGIGPVTASKIIDYRNKNGRFKRKEDIKNVSGIGDKTYEKIKDLIGV